MNHDETTARQSAAESIANEVDAARADANQWRATYQQSANATDTFLGDLLDLLPGAKHIGSDAWDQIPRAITTLTAERDALKAALERAWEWAASDVVTGKSPFGDGYREAMRDMRDILKTAAKEKGSSSPGGSP